MSIQVSVAVRFVIILISLLSLLSCSRVAAICIGAQLFTRAIALLWKNERQIANKSNNKYKHGVGCQLCGVVMLGYVVFVWVFVLLPLALHSSTVIARVSSILRFICYLVPRIEFSLSQKLVIDACLERIKASLEAK